MPFPLAYFITWTTYGTRLHGDERGSVDLAHNRSGTPLLSPNEEREHAVQTFMKHPPYLLGESERPIVEQVMRDHCSLRSWTILALNVRTNHVHLVLNCKGTHSPERAMTELKSWGTRRLVEAKLVERGRSLWTDHGSTRWINTSAGLAEAIDYVLNQQ